MHVWNSEYLDEHGEPTEMYGVAQAYEELGQSEYADEIYSFAHDLASIRNLPSSPFGHEPYVTKGLPK